MPFLAPSFARCRPLAFLLAGQMESRKNIACHLGVSLRTLQRYQASGTRAENCEAYFNEWRLDGRWDQILSILDVTRCGNERYLPNVPTRQHSLRLHDYEA